MKIAIEIDEKVIRDLVFKHIAEKLGDVDLNPADVKIEVKSTQNWKAEWETAAFRARVEKSDA